MPKELTVKRFMDRRGKLIERYNAYRDEHYEVSTNFRPRRGKFLMHYRKKNQGNPTAQKIINTTPTEASRNAQSGLQAGITSPGRPWKKMGPDNQDALDIPGAREFFELINQRMDAMFSRSNLYEATHTGYADFVDFGACAIQGDPDEENGMHFTVHPMGTWFASNNARGRADAFYRDYLATLDVLVEKFGLEALPQEMKEKYEDDPYSEHDVYNAVEKNPFYKQGIPGIGLAGFKYISVWWMKGSKDKFLHTHGYHEFPVFVARANKSDSSDVYGHGFGLVALGDAKQMQHQETQKLRAIDKMVEPAMQGPPSLKTARVSSVPNSMTYVSGGEISNLQNVNLPLQYVYQDIAECERRIRSIYFNDLFLMITQTTQRQTTAREIEEKHQEKLLMLGPVLEMLNKELLDPLVERALGVMRRNGTMPEAPEQLEGVEFKTEYVSILAQAQQAARTIPMEQGLNFAFGMAKGKPEALDLIKEDDLLREYLQQIGYPAKGLASEKELQQIRAARQARQQQVEQAEALQQQANTAKTASEATLTTPNVLTELLGGAAGVAA